MPLATNDILALAAVIIGLIALAAGLFIMADLPKKQFHYSQAALVALTSWLKTPTPLWLWLLSLILLGVLFILGTKTTVDVLMEVIDMRMQILMPPLEPATSPPELVKPEVWV